MELDYMQKMSMSNILFILFILVEKKKNMNQIYE